MKKSFFLFCLLASFFPANNFAQVVRTYPLFPTQDDNVTVYFDATQGNGALAGYGGTVYAHTGVTISPGSTTWNYVQGNWGTADPHVQMTAVSTDLYSISYKIDTFYDFPIGTVVDRLSFVFRNADGSIVGRNADGSDIFYKVWDGTSLITKFLTPTATPVFVNLNDQVNSIFVTSKLATITLYQNNNYVTQFINTDSVNYNFTASSSGTTWIKAVADDGNTQVADSFAFIVNPTVTVAPLPAGTDVGINYINDSTVTLVLVAPNKNFVYAVGDFSNWGVNDSFYMNLTPDGNDWWVTLNNLTPQQEYRYQFLVDGNLHIADPYTDKILDPSNDPFISSSTYPNLIAYPAGQASGNVSIFQTAATPYAWQDAGYVKPNQTNLVIYELLMRDFLAAHDYKTLADTINYLKKLGVNAIELMPITEFSGNLSWGYNPNFYFAPDKYYGPKDDLKKFIDLCHQNGIAVIQDVVFNQSDGASPMCQLYWDAVNNQPAADNPWYNQVAPHPYSVFYDFNHESDYTHKFVDDVLKYWTTQYHMDGYRFDLSKGFTQTQSTEATAGNYDQSRIDNIERIADQIWTVDPSSYLILEHFCADNEEQVLSAHGLMLWDKVQDGFYQSAMGYVSGSDISRISYLTHGFSQPHAVGYMESHDEERMMFKVISYGNSNGTYNVKPLDSALNRIKQAACFFFPIPGPKMLWEFGELGYDYSICYPGNLNDCKRTDNKPIKWDYLQYGPRKWVYNFFSALLGLRNQYPVFQSGTFYMDVGDLHKSIRLTDGTMKVCILGNFDIVNFGVIPYFLNTGKWYEYFTGDSINVTDLNAPISMKPGEYRLYTNVKLQQPDLGNVGINDLQHPNEMQLQCIPNPVSETATLDFYLPNPGTATLELYDMMGRKVKIIANKNFARGWYTVAVPFAELQDGFYICKLSVAGMQKVVRVEVQH